MNTESQTTYRRLAKKILGVEELEVVPLGLPGWDCHARRNENAGDLTNLDEQRLLAKICQLVSGLTDSYWARLGEEQRIPWLEIAAEENSPTEERDWSKAKSPADWQKELKFSPSTWQRYINDGKLIVKKITTKNVSIRMDSLRTFKGDK